MYASPALFPELGAESFAGPSIFPVFLAGIAVASADWSPLLVKNRNIRPAYAFYSVITSTLFVPRTRN
jgi:hypothetical protein